MTIIDNNKCEIGFLSWKEQIAHWHEYKEYNQDGVCERCDRKAKWVVGNEDGTIGCWYCLYSRYTPSMGLNNHHETCENHSECEEEALNKFEQWQKKLNKKVEFKER